MTDIVIQLSILEVSLQCHPITISRVVGECIQPALGRIIRGEDNELVKRLVGGDDFLTPVAKDIAQETWIRITGVDSAVFVNAKEAW